MDVFSWAWLVLVVAVAVAFVVIEGLALYLDHTRHDGGRRTFSAKVQDTIGQVRWLRDLFVGLLVGTATWLIVHWFD